MKLARVLPASFAVSSFAVIAVFLGSTVSAAAAPAPHAMVAGDANKVLAEVDRRAAVFADQQYNASMAIYRGDELKKTLTFSMVMKGLDKQFITFTAPGDIAGMKVLMPDADTLYVYTPEFKKVRRVAAHMQNQGFLGSTFTYEDMTQVALGRFFNAALAGREGSKTTLTLTPKAGVTTTYARVEIVIDGTKGGVTHLRYYDGAGSHVRSQLRDGWTKIAGELMPTEITMIEHKSGDKTVIKLSDVRVNQGVEDDAFSRRNLLRG